jgi:hypothetical protein
MEGVEVGGVGDAKEEQSKEEAMPKDMLLVCFSKKGSHTFNFNFEDLSEQCNILSIYENVCF